MPMGQVKMGWAGRPGPSTTLSSQLRIWTDSSWEGKSKPKPAKGHNRSPSRERRRRRRRRRKMYHPTRGGVRGGRDRKLSLSLLGFLSPRLIRWYVIWFHGIPFFLRNNRICVSLSFLRLIFGELHNQIHFSRGNLKCCYCKFLWCLYNYEQTLVVSLVWIWNK